VTDESKLPALPEAVAYGRWARGLPPGTRLMRYDGVPLVSHEPRAGFDVALYTAAQMHAYASQAVAAVAEDAGRLDWLEANEMSLVTHREGDGEDGYTIWWSVVRVKKCRGDSVSGHPLGDLRFAIDAARKQEKDHAK
jgi:hypothetical protein